MPIRSRSRPALALRLALAVVLATVAVGAHPPTAQPQILPSVPTPCDLPGAAWICDLPNQVASRVVEALSDSIMRGVTAWVTNAAVWVTGEVGELIEATSSPDVQAEWFRSQYGSMLAVAGVLALPLLLLAVIQAVMRQDGWILVRSAFGYLPMAFILAVAAIVGTDLLVSITDDLAGMVNQGLGGSSDNLLESVGQAYSQGIEDTSEAVPLFGIFLGAILLAIGAFVLWLEMVIRDAAIYIALFFLPLTFIAMIWPATSRYARRLVELLIAVILAKFVIVAIIGLASAAITNAGALGGGDDGQLFERMIAGAALLLLAAWSPFALLRLIPMMEIAAVSVMTQRSSMSGAAQSAGVSSPAAYMRQAIDRRSRASASPASSSAGGTTYSRVEHSEDARFGRSEASEESGIKRQREEKAEHTTVSRSGTPSSGPGGATYAPPDSSPPGERRAPEHPPSERPAPPRPSPPPPRRTPPPDPPNRRWPPDEERER